MKEVWMTPRTWADIPLDQQLFATSYEHVPSQPFNAGNLRKQLEIWSTRCEQAVDHTMQIQHAIDPEVHPTPSLPKQCRGRLKTRKLQKQPVVNRTKQACNGQYNPVLESCSMTMKHWTRQIRRLQSFRNCARKHVTDDHLANHQLQLDQEWKAITTAPGFYGGFPNWCANIPELSFFPYALPDLDYVDLVIDLLKLKADDKAHHERQMHRANSTWPFAKLFDDKQQRMKVAARKAKGPTMPLLSEVQVTKHFPFRLLSRQHGLLQIELQVDDCLHLQQIATCQQTELLPFAQQGRIVDAYIIDDQLDLPAVDTLQQTAQTQHPVQVANELTEFWSGFWNRDDPDAPTTPEFRQLLQEVPHLPEISIDVETVDRWVQAVRHMKHHSAKGADGWSTSELKLLPTRAFRDLAIIFHNATQEGFGSRDMTVFTLPIGKHDQPKGPADTRPISLMTMLYRLWSKVTTTQILAQLANRLPASIVGFIPGRSLTATMVAQQY